MKLSIVSFLKNAHAGFEQAEAEFCKRIGSHAQVELIAIQAMMNRGESNLVFVIGGPEGMPREAASKVQERWSLSTLTFSHTLARLVLLEALYRSFDILHGGRYHK